MIVSDTSFKWLLLYQKGAIYMQRIRYFVNGKLYSVNLLFSDTHFSIYSSMCYNVGYPVFSDNLVDIHPPCWQAW